MAWEPAIGFHCKRLPNSATYLRNIAPGTFSELMGVWIGEVGGGSLTFLLRIAVDFILPYCVIVPLIAPGRPVGGTSFRARHSIIFKPTASSCEHLSGLLQSQHSCSLLSPWGILIKSREDSQPDQAAEVDWSN